MNLTSLSVRLIGLTLAGLLLGTSGLVIFGTAWGQSAQQEESVRREESEDYYEKWLEVDVVYIITSDEESVFKNLATDEEREQFIEQFWHRRDPDLTTPGNEYKEEHYRRIAYVNERFKSGVPGWRTDRGRVYIIHGPPVEIESHKTGQSYTRPSHEGGGQTVTYAFEIWRYNYIEGIGDDIELEFVDRSGSGEFRLAITPWEKDALLMIPGAGLTIAEELGVATRRDHPYFKPYNADRYTGMHTRMKDDPFIRYETIAKIQRPAQVKYKDLKEIVEVNVQYNNLPFKTQQDFFRLNEQQVLVPLTIEIKNRDLSFALENGIQVGRVAVYGMITSLRNRVVAEFEDELVVSFKQADLPSGLQGRSVYQKTLPLEAKMRYRLDLVVKDLNSDQVGVTRLGIIPPSFDPESLSTSSLILSDYLRPEDDEKRLNEMFVIGDIKVRPNLAKVFDKRDPFWIYLHVYNAALDQTNLNPALTASFRVSKNGEAVFEDVDDKGESIQFYSGQRVVLIRQLPLEGLELGKYQIEVEVSDRISDGTVAVTEDFEVGG
jgi:GWxTD domain-containing protein